MNGKTNQEPINLLLSRDELLYALRGLDAAFVPGLDPEPLGERTAAEQELALTVAERSLRARELVRVLPDGNRQIHTAMLTMVGVCAYPQTAVLAYHWPAGADTPLRYFGHLRGDDVVSHLRPEEALHLFSLLPDKATLIDQLLAFCNWQDTAAVAKTEFTVDSDSFAAARAAADSGDTARAAETLIGGGVGAAAAGALAVTLANSPRVSILQIVRPAAGGVQKQDVTLLQDDNRTWLAVAAANQPLRVQSAGRDDVRELLAGWL